MTGRKKPQADVSLPLAQNPVDSFQKTPKATGRKSASMAPSLPAKVKAIPEAAKTATVREIQEVQGKPKAPDKRGGRRVPSGGISRRPGKPRGKVNGKDKEGRPPSMSAEIKAEILEAVEEDGMSEGRAALAAGISPSTLSRWKLRGRAADERWDKLAPNEQAEESPYREFFKGLRDAEPKFERANLKIIKTAAKGGDWRAANRRLELRFPLKYGKKFMVGGDPENKTPVQTAITAHSSDLTDQEIKARAERILKASTATARATGKKAPAER